MSHYAAGLGVHCAQRRLCTEAFHTSVGCRNRVKFWFIKNYASPQMKRFLPLMAERYGFEYEFVTYKWPTWLHKQVCLPHQHHRLLCQHS